MDAPFGEKLEITEINPKFLIANNKWKMGFMDNAPVGWEPGDEIRLSPITKPGVSQEVSEARVQVENLALVAD